MLDFRSICSSIHTESLMFGSALFSNRALHVPCVQILALAAAWCKGILPSCKININSKCDYFENNSYSNAFHPFIFNMSQRSISLVKEMLCGLFIFTLEQIIVLNKYCTYNEPILYRWPHLPPICPAPTAPLHPDHYKHSPVYLLITA